MAEKRLNAVKSGDKAAFEELLIDYEPLIRAQSALMISKLPDFKNEEEEFCQEGRLALYDAAMKYQEGGEVTFGLYAKICVHNRLLSYARKLSAAKRRQDKALEYKQSVGHQSSAEEYALALARSNELKEIISSSSSALEKRVFDMYLQKMSYADIARAVNKNEKSVANAICRVKQKVKKYLK